MEKITLKANIRSLQGRKVKRLRESGIVPANIFGKKADSRAIELSRDAFDHAFAKAGETTLIELEVGDEKTPVLVSNVQVDPVTDETLHVDFHAVNLKEKVTATVPVELIGESPAEKSGIGTVVLQLAEIEVEALPMDLPEKFEVDAASLIEVDQAVYIKDLAYDKEKVEIKQEADALVAKVEPPQAEEVVEVPAVPTEAEGEEAPKSEEATPESEDTQAPQEN